MAENMTELNSLEALEAHFFGRQVPECQEIDFMCSQIDPESRYAFFDIGANVGFYSYYLNLKLRNSQIFCIEADPLVYAELARNVQSWDTSNNNEIRCINKAVSDSPGRILFHSSRDLTVGSIVPGSQALRHHGITDRIEVESIKLDALVAQANISNDQPMLWKIDVEGAEFRVLCGAMRSLDLHQNLRLLLEIHWWGDNELNKKPRDVCNLLIKKGFAFQLIGTHWFFERAGSARLLRCLLRNYWRFLLQLRGRAYPLDLLKRMCIT